MQPKTIKKRPRVRVPRNFLAMTIINGSRNDGRAGLPVKALRHSSERGQSLTELAVSFAVLVLILAVAVDLGRAFFSLISLREAAEEGAVYGSLNSQDSPGIIARVRSSSTTPVDLADTSTVTVTVSTPGGTCAGNSMVVSVTYQFNLTMPMVGTLIGTQTFPLSVSATSTILRPEC